MGSSCPICHGRGRIPCRLCFDGSTSTGRVVYNGIRSEAYAYPSTSAMFKAPKGAVPETCPTCRGAGVVTCPGCGGSGVSERMFASGDRSLNFSIKASVKSGLLPVRFLRSTLGSIWITLSAVT